MVPQKKRWRARILVATLISLIVSLVLCAAFPEFFLQVRSSPINGDAMVVLGGEPKVRTRQAAKLFLEKRAPLILLSGHGDCEGNTAELLQDGVHESAILLECESTSTKENAEFSIQLLRERKAKRVILVTSWYHSRRALQTFSKAAPEIEFISLPAPRVKIRWKYERGYIFNEYLKIIYYAVRWGVSPI